MGNRDQSEGADTCPICRCEEVALEAVEQAIAEGAQ
jgi:hypothetical protein